MFQLSFLRESRRKKSWGFCLSEHPSKNLESRNELTGHSYTSFLQTHFSSVEPLLIIFFLTFLLRFIFFLTFLSLVPPSFSESFIFALELIFLFFIAHLLIFISASASFISQLPSRALSQQSSPSIFISFWAFLVLTSTFTSRNEVHLLKLYRQFFLN